MKKQDKIKELYFNEKYSQKEIAGILKVSTKYVSKILLLDARYEEEKERRKLLSKQKHKANTINYINRNRKNKKQDDIYQHLQQMHQQASRELSGRRVINNQAFRKWNSSIYNYNKNTNAYHLKRGIVTGFDAPKKINCKIL